MSVAGLIIVKLVIGASKLGLGEALIELDGLCDRDGVALVDELGDNDRLAELEGDRLELGLNEAD